MHRFCFQFGEGQAENPAMDKSRFTCEMTL